MPPSRAITKASVVEAARIESLDIRDTSFEVAICDPKNHKPVMIFEKKSKRLQLGFITTFRMARMVSDLLFEICQAE